VAANAATAGHRKWMMPGCCCCCWHLCSDKHGSEESAA
jgi:hypothetical protein